MSEVDGIQDVAFPSRAVRLIDPFGAGGGPDIIGRAVAERLSEVWGQRVVVENHTGAGSTVAPALVAKAPADGYTLLINTSAHAYSTVFSTALSYDPLLDFVPVAALTSQPYVLVAGARSGITSVRELVSAAEASPGNLRFASAGVGTGTHIAVEKLNRDLRISAAHTPPGAADSMSDVVAGTAAGRTEYTMSPISFAAPHLQDGGLVPLGVSTLRRSHLLPEVPSLAEVGDTGFDFPIWYGVWAPARTPSEIVRKLGGDIANVLASAELSDWLIRHDAEPLRMTRAEFVAFVRSESERAVLLLSSG
jgi:tripartite-type tricarboxylate transporter receptor subunit TctC